MFYRRGKCRPRGGQQRYWHSAAELDAVNHQPDWQPIDPPLFAERVEEFTSAPGWVVDGNYSAVRGLVWDRADTVIWLDLPRWLVMRRVIWRTLRRLADLTFLRLRTRKEIAALMRATESVDRGDVGVCQVEAE